MKKKNIDVLAIIEPPKNAGGIHNSIKGSSDPTRSGQTDGKRVLPYIMIPKKEATWKKTGSGTDHIGGFAQRNKK